MSARHRSAEPKPAPADRRIEHHRERQAVRHALIVPDPDDIVDPRSHHSLHVPTERQAQADGHAPSRPFRYWKLPFWKRRNAMRHRRNEELDAIRAAND